MRYVLTNAQMREADKFTIETLEVPSLLLMERAGAALAEKAERLCPEGGILCVCGGGNNGGDGFVCARILLQKGLSVEALCVADKFSADCKKNRDEFEKLGGEVYSVFPRKRFALIVDCLFGTGFSGGLEGKTPLRRILSIRRARRCFRRTFLRAFREITVSPRKTPSGRTRPCVSGNTRRAYF